MQPYTARGLSTFQELGPFIGYTVGIVSHDEVPALSCATASRMPCNSKDGGGSEESLAINKSTPFLTCLRMSHAPVLKEIGKPFTRLWKRPIGCSLAGILKRLAGSACF